MLQNTTAIDLNVDELLTSAAVAVKSESLREKVKKSICCGRIKNLFNL